MLHGLNSDDHFLWHSRVKPEMEKGSRRVLLDERSP